MIIFQINTVAYGSTGQTSKDLAYALEKNGHECFIAYGQGTSDYKKSYKIGTRIENHIHNVYSRILGKQGYKTSVGTRKLVRHIKRTKPDLIHLRNLHGNYINLKILFEFLASADIPVVWTLHDCWSFTGKCSHYTEIGCYKWQTLCHHCPQVKKYPPSLLMDRSELMFEDKKKWFTSIKNLTIVPVSHWLAAETRKSFFSGFPIVPVYNWIDQEIFKHYEPGIRRKFGLADNQFVILGASAGWSHKGSKLADFKKLSGLLQDNMQIILVGGRKKLESLPANMSHITYITEQKEIAELYSMADVYVHMSVEDTFGKIIAETMSCGTPAIVYNSTACPELIRPGCGYVVEKRNIAEIYNSICQVKANGKGFYTENCIRNVRSHFEINQNISKIIELYQNILSK
jgi:putative colanic acid biosynthesis glycosyltransferase